MNTIAYSAILALLIHFHSYSCLAFSTSSCSPHSSLISSPRTFRLEKTHGGLVHPIVLLSHTQGNEEEDGRERDTSTSVSSDRKGFGFSQDTKKNKYNNKDDMKKTREEFNSGPLVIPKTTSTRTATTTTSSAAEFELQELRAQLKEMAQKNINSASLSNEKRQELEGYVQRVCETATTSPIPLPTIATTRPTPLLGLWRLVFSTEKATLSILPREATVYINILTSPREAGDEGILEYTLKFSMGALREIKAISTYTIDVSTLGILPTFSSSITTFYITGENPFCYPVARIIPIPKIAWSSLSRISYICLSRNYIWNLWVEEFTCGFIWSIERSNQLYTNHLL
jgi:hypothetical protein